MSAWTVPRTVDKVQAFYAKINSVTAQFKQTVTNPTKLRQLIDECRKNGYSAIEDELAYGVVALAVPVFDQRGRVGAASVAENSSGRHHAGNRAGRGRFFATRTKNATPSTRWRRVPLTARRC